MENYIERKKRVMQSHKRDISGKAVYRKRRNGTPVLKEKEAEVVENVKWFGSKGTQ